MKLFRNIMIASSALVLALAVSCEQEPQGKGDATIGFAKETYVYKESAGLVKIPIQFTGEPKTYPITFDIVAEVDGEELKLEDLVHFTQSKGLKYAGNPKAPVYLEFQIYDNQEINDSRFINLSIENVSGATLAGTGKASLELSDNDNNPYERLMGNWVLSGTSPFDGKTTTTEVNISGGFSADEENVNFEKTLVCWGLGGEQFELKEGEPRKQPVWYMSYDGEGKTLTLQTGTLVSDQLQFGIATVEEVKMAALYINSDGDMVYSTDYNGVTATWSDDMNTITFAPDTGIYAVIYGDGEDTGYGWAGYFNVTMTRK
ncbi:MAG: hypothetical protein IJ940_07800 [Bacteroidales bacterium]|nr:hypothetical protein [Bacteroidales bacterium]